MKLEILDLKGRRSVYDFTSAKVANDQRQTCYCDSSLTPTDVYSFCSDDGCCWQGEVGPQGLSGREGHWGALGKIGERGPKGEKGHIGLMVSRAATIS